MLKLNSFSFSELPTTLDFEDVDDISNLVYEMASCNSPIDELNQLITYMSSVISKYKSMFLKSDDWDDCNQFTDTVNSIMMFSMKTFMSTVNFELTMLVFIEQFLKLLYKDGEFLLVAIKQYRDNYDFRYKIVVEPIIQNEENKISSELAFKQAKFIINILNMQKDGSKLSISVIKSGLWINDYFETNNPEIINDNVIVGFFKINKSAYEGMLIERKRLLDAKFNIEVEYEKDEDESVYDDVEDMPVMDQYAAYLNYKISEFSNELFEPNSHNKIDLYVPDKSFDVSFKSVSEQFAKEFDSEKDLYLLVDVISALTRKKYHSDSEGLRNFEEKNKSLFNDKVVTISDIEKIFEETTGNTKTVEEEIDSNLQTLGLKLKGEEELKEKIDGIEVIRYEIEDSDINLTFDYLLDMMKLSNEFHDITTEMFKNIVNAIKIRVPDISISIVEKTDNNELLVYLGKDSKQHIFSFHFSKNRKCTKIEMVPSEQPEGDD